MSVVSEISGRAGLRRPATVQIAAIAVVWVLLFAAAYALASRSGTKTQAQISPLATGAPVAATTALASNPATPKPATIVGLPSAPGAPALKLKAKPKPAVHTTASVSRPVVTAPVTRTQSASPPVTVTPPPVTTPPPSTTHSTGSGSGSTGQTGTGTVSGGG
jgi:hypothetical protein